MYKIKNNESGDRAELILSGSITIQNAAELKDSITEFYKDIKYLEIDHNNAENFDLSYLQILLSLKKTMDADGKVLNLKELKKNVFNSLLETSGYHGKDFSAELLNDKPEGNNDE